MNGHSYFHSVKRDKKTKPNAERLLQFDYREATTTTQDRILLNEYCSMFKLDIKIL